jgi:hypothetical protein
LSILPREPKLPTFGYCGAPNGQAYVRRLATLVGFGAFAAFHQEQISEKISRRILSGDQGIIVWWSIAAGVQQRCAYGSG